MTSSERKKIDEDAAQLRSPGYVSHFDRSMSWPRNPTDPWYSNYGVIVTASVVVLLGLPYMTAARPYGSDHAPAGDAHHLPVARGAPISD